MGKKLFIVVSLIMILMTSILSISVFAADGESSGSFTLTMNATNSKVAPGGEVLITVKISSLNVGSSGISQFSAYLDYDTDVFEQLTESSVDGTDGWKPSYNVGTKKIQLYREKALKTDGEIMQISLKTKSDVEDGTQGKISFSSIFVSDSVNEFSTQPISTSITVTSNPGAGAVGSGTNTQTNTQPVPLNIGVNTTPQNQVEQPVNNTVNNVVNNTVNNVVNNSSNEIEVVNEVESDMPYTGTDGDALIRIIIGVIFIGLVMYIKIEKMNKDIK